MTDLTISEALEAYYERFAEDDWTAIADMFDVPALLVVGERRLVLDSRGAVVDMYRRLRAKFTAEGVAGIAWDRERLVVFPLHEGVSVARVVVTRYGATGGTIRTWTCSYTVRRAADSWRFNLITSDEIQPAQRQSAGSEPARWVR